MSNQLTRDCGAVRSQRQSLRPTGDHALLCELDQGLRIGQQSSAGVKRDMWNLWYQRTPGIIRHLRRAVRRVPFRILQRFDAEAQFRDFIGVFGTF